MGEITNKEELISAFTDDECIADASQFKNLDEWKNDALINESGFSTFDCAVAKGIENECIKPRKKEFRKITIEDTQDAMKKYPNVKEWIAKDRATYLYAKKCRLI